jgi:peptidyl-prolyl cis-trans isomerase SurA
MKRLAILWIVVLSVFFQRHVPAQQTVDGIVAVVGNEIILVSDLTTLLYQYSMQTGQNVFNDRALMEKMQKQLLRRMIDEKVLLIKAEEDTIIADDERVEQVLDQQIGGFIQQAGSPEALEKAYGMPLAKIKKEFRQQIANRMIIEQLRQKYFSDVKVSRREVENFYKHYQDSLPQMDEIVDISHILMRVTPSPESLQEAYAKITAIKEKLDNGEDFTALAEKYSEDPSAAVNKGDLGWVSRGDFVKEFEEAAFALEPGEISDIVQTQFGFHIIQLIDKSGERVRTRHILIRLQPTGEDERRVVNRLNDIRVKVLSGKDTFEEMALKNSDDPNVGGDKGRLGEFAVGKFQVPAFDEAVKGMQPGDISAPFKTDFGYHILLLHSRQASRPISLNDDWQRVEQLAKDFKSSQEFEKWLEELRQEIPIEIKLDI